MPGQGEMQEKDMVTDALASQKYLTSSYNTAATEAANQDLRRDLMNILNDEHKNQERLWNVMNQKGWYKPSSADQQQLNQTKTKYTQIQNQLQGGEGQSS